MPRRNRTWCTSAHRSQELQVRLADWRLPTGNIEVPGFKLGRAHKSATISNNVAVVTLAAETCAPRKHKRTSYDPRWHQSSSHPKRGTLAAWHAAAASGLHDCKTAPKVCASGHTLGKHPSRGVVKVRGIPPRRATSRFHKRACRDLRTRALTTVTAKPCLLDTVGNPPVAVMVPESKQMTQ